MQNQSKQYYVENILMYADDTVVYIYAKTEYLAASKLTMAIEKVISAKN